MSTTVLFLSLSLASFSSSFAETAKFKLSKSVVSFDVPSDWQAIDDFAGLPLAILGPDENILNDSRPIITVVDSGVKAEIDPKVLEKEQGDYEMGRREWLKEYDGKALKFYPYKQIKFSKVQDVHQIGFEYSLGEAEDSRAPASSNEFAENSYYLTCDGKFFFIKTVIKKSKMEKYNKTMDAILNSFDCK